MQNFQKHAKKSAQMFNYKVVQIPTEQISANKQQPRSHFDTNQMIRLADSIRRYGIIQPLTVRVAVSNAEIDGETDNIDALPSCFEGIHSEHADERVKIYNKTSFIKDFIESQTDSATAKTEIYSQNGTKNPLYITREYPGDREIAPKLPKMSAYSSSKEYFELVSGERRLRAARLLGLPTVPCIILEADDNESAEIAIIENLQRENLNIFEQGEAYRNLIQRFGMTQEEIASKMGISQSTVANKIRLLALEDDEREILLESGLTERHARALLRIKHYESRRHVLAHIISYKLNVEESERYIDRFISDSTTKSSSIDASNKKMLTDLGSERVFGGLYKGITRAITSAKASGLAIYSSQEETENEITIKISIPKQASVI